MRCAWAASEESEHGTTVIAAGAKSAFAAGDTPSRTRPLTPWANLRAQLKHKPIGWRRFIGSGVRSHAGPK